MSHNSNACFMLVFLFCVPVITASSEDGTRKITTVLSHDQNIFDSEPPKAILSHGTLASLPPAFTICSTIMAPFIHDLNDVLEFFCMLGENGICLWGIATRVQFFVTNKGIETTYNYGKGWRDLENHGKDFHAFSHQWIKHCGALNRSTGLYQAVVDGILVANQTLSERFLANMPTNLNEKIVLGALYEYGTGNWVPTKNKVTNLNIFSTAHSLELMRQNTMSRKCIDDGDYLAWNDMKWTLYGQAVFETVDQQETCMGQPPMVVYPASMHQLSCMRLCENLGSRAPSIITVEEWLAIENFLQHYDEFGVLWVAIDDEEKEGEWRDHYTGQVMNHPQAWLPGKPNGVEHENHAVLLKNASGMIGIDDSQDDYKYACMCENRPQSYLKLRGLCKDSAIDTYYLPKNNLTDIRQLRLIGLHTAIEFDQVSDLWKLSVAESNVTALSKTTHTSLALGKYNWTVNGDKACNKVINSDSYTIELKMSGCKDGQFTCNDGQCVSMDKRCDQLPNCRDKSDEKNCRILVLEDGYNKNIPPITSGKKEEKIPVNVNTSIDIFKLVDINEEDYSIEIQFQITLVWKENRATYQNLKEDESLNALTQKDIQELWLPEVIYENTDQKDTTRLGVAWEWKTDVQVKRGGSLLASGLEIVDETSFYQGNESSLIMSQTYTHGFQCQYDFIWYPFDTQVKPVNLYQNNKRFASFCTNLIVFHVPPQTCLIEMAVRLNSRDTVHLIPGEISMKQNLDMTMFTITLYDLDYIDNRDGIRVLIVMKRKFMSEIMTTYFPSFLLLAITFATTFFKPFFFEAALSVNLTTMLVMTTIFISKMEGLPPTSDIKMIDIWLVLCQMVPFAEVVLVTAMEYQRTDEEKDVAPMFRCVTVNPVNGEEIETMEEEKKWFQKINLKQWIPSLKTLGEFRNKH